MISTKREVQSNHSDNSSVNLTNFKTVNKIESIFIAVVLSGTFLAHLATTFYLDSLRAFDQYNLFFDADANQYISAVSHGWSFNRSIHPGFALLFNVPTRALDYLISFTGLVEVGTVRKIMPLLIPSISGGVAGFFWWLACYRINLPPLARIAGTILFLGSFSQILFTTVPESYPVSGMLYTVLLWATASIHQKPQLMDYGAVRIGWIGLAFVMTGVTITNGFVCLLVWLALRFRQIPKRKWLVELVLGTCIITASIPTITALDRWAYTLDPVNINNNLHSISNFALSFKPDSVLKRALELPSHALTSIVAPNLDMIPNKLAEINNNKYQFGFSFTESAISVPRLIIAWCLVLGGMFISLPRIRFSGLARACLAIFVFNLGLHMVWGAEIFLYSQHWLAFLVFAITASIARTGKIGIFILIISSLAVMLSNGAQFTQMILYLSDTV